MTEWAPSLVRIEKIEKHPNANALDIATVLGDYPVCTKINQYKVGDLVGYLPLETVVPDVEMFYFLCPKSYEKYEENGEIKQRMVGPKYELGSVPAKYRRIKAKQMVGVYSMGMVVDAPPDLKEGDSIVEFYSLTKFEEEEEDNIPNAKKAKGANAASPPQGWTIPYYDIDGLRKFISCVKEDEEIVLTEKIHGSNSGFSHDGSKLWTKSRNFYKKFDEDDLWWDAAIRYKLEEKLSKYPMKVFFGELYGTVKGFRYDCEIVNGVMPSKLRFFDIFDVKTSRYLDYDDFKTIINDLQLDAVPELYRGKYTNKSDIYFYAEGMSTLNPKHIREGFVIKTIKERYEPKLNGRFQFKLIGEGYSLQK